MERKLTLDSVSVCLLQKYIIIKNKYIYKAQNPRNT